MSEASQPEVARFARRFLSALGAAVAELEEGMIEAALPPELARELRCEPAIRLRFTPQEPEGSAESDYLTFGHPLLDRMLELVRGRGSAASLLVWSGAEEEFVEAVHKRSPFTGELEHPRPGEAEGSAPAGESPGLRRFRKMLEVTGRLSFPNAKVRVVSRRIVYQPQLLFNFKVAVTADEKKEWVIPLLVDPVSERVDRPVDVSSALSFAPEAGGQAEGRRYTLERLYRTACRHLEKRILSEASAFERASKERLAKELARIDEYYEGLFEERKEPLQRLYRKMAAAAVQAGLARTWRGESRLQEQLLIWREEANALEAERERELAALRIERERRIEELREKHRVRAEVRLTQGAFVLVPRVEWRLRLHGPARREAVLSYDIVRRRLTGWECEHCGVPLGGQVWLCRCSALVCGGCGAACPGCDGFACALCAPAACHVCGGPAGCSCGSGCPLATSIGAARELAVCARCRKEHCASCAAAVGHLLEEALGGG